MSNADDLLDIIRHAKHINPEVNANLCFRLYQKIGARFDRRNEIIKNYEDVFWKERHMYQIKYVERYLRIKISQVEKYAIKAENQGSFGQMV